MIRVLIIDVLATHRVALTAILDGMAGIEVLGAVGDPSIARDKIKKLAPDLILLNIDQKGRQSQSTDWLRFLARLQRYSPIPTIAVATKSTDGAQLTIRALSLGAVDFIALPEEGDIQELAPEIISKVRAGHRSRRRSIPPIGDGASTWVPGPGVQAEKKVSVDEVLPLRRCTMGAGRDVICIGASTGGTQAIEYLLRRLPPTLPGIVIVEHMPKYFTGPYAARLNSLSALTVVEAEEGMVVKDGHALIGPGDQHVLLARRGQGYEIELRDGPRVTRHKPSVDVLFRSAANVAGAGGTGIILTGMGDDGARGLKDMRDAGAMTIAQDEASCIVFGMPKVAIELGGAVEIAALEDIPSRLIRRFTAPRSGSRR